MLDMQREGPYSKGEWFKSNGKMAGFIYLPGGSGSSNNKLIYVKN
jgi:hypothetical protein